VPTRPIHARTCCLDLDTFFVSVERLLDPSLQGKPVVVGGHKGQRGVVTAASYEVRTLGVRSGMSMADAVRLAPHAIYLPTRHGTYGPYAARVRAVLERYSPVVQTASIDEFFMDFRGTERMYGLPGDADADATIARVVGRMRQEIQDEVGLPASAGIGASRPVAKICSALAKPAGVCMVRPDQARAVLGPLPVRRYPGIGPVMDGRLRAAGIETLGQLLDLPPGPHRAWFGHLSEQVQVGLLRGSTAVLGPDRPAFREHDPQGLAAGSVSNERTFMADVGDEREIRDQLRALTERVCWRVRKRGIQARTVALKLRYADFQTLSRARTISPTHDEAVVYPVVLELLDRARTRRLPVRLLGVELSHMAGPDLQLGLPFQDRSCPPVGRAIDEVRRRFGYDAIRLGAVGPARAWID